MPQMQPLSQEFEGRLFIWNVIPENRVRERRSETEKGGQPTMGVLPIRFSLAWWELNPKVTL